MMNFISRIKYLRVIFQAFVIIITSPLIVFCYLFKKDNDIWVFGNVFGYKDNAKYLYEYVKSEHKDINAVWIRKNKSGGEGYYYLSLKGLYYQYRASKAFLTTGMNDFARFALANKMKIQLWHGIPVKKILLDSNEMLPFKESNKFANCIFKAVLRRQLDRYNYIISANEHNKECLAKAFGVCQSKILDLGLPRHDIIIENVQSDDVFRIIYAPTWQSSSVNAEKIISNVLSDDFINFCKMNEIELWVSIHPLNTDIKKHYELLDGINVFSGGDINISLGEYSILITDYSSIALDFSILNRPVIFCCEDRVKYKAERGIYDYFETIIDKRNVEPSDIKIEVEKLISNPLVDNDFYNLNVDGCARHRIVKTMKGIQ